MRNLLITALLLACCFSLAVTIEPRLVVLPIYAGHEAPPLERVLGNSRKLFADRFFAKADAYFHSGLYPSIFDSQKSAETPHVAADADAMHKDDHEEEADFLGPPRDWIDRFSRAFFPSSHSHLDHGGPSGKAEPPGDLGESSDVREILPWVRLSAELDPEKVETYVVGSYWLRNRMGKVDEAEAFLREGLRANPGSHAILFELGRIYSENRHDPARARNLWEAALKRWNETEKPKKEPNTFLLSQISWHLALLEEQAGQFDKAIQYLEIAREVSPKPQEAQARVDEIKARKK